MQQQQTQPKGFAILIPEEEDKTAKKNTVTLEELKDLAGSWMIRGLDRIVQAKLTMLSDDELRHFTFEVTYKQRRVISSELSEVHGSFDIWHHKNGFAIAIDCPSFMVEVVAAFISLSIYGEIGIFRGQNFRKETFLKMQRYALSLGGVLSVLHLRDLKIDGSEMAVYNLSGKNIGNPIEQIEAAKK